MVPAAKAMRRRVSSVFVSVCRCAWLLFIELIGFLLVCTLMQVAVLLRCVVGFWHAGFPYCLSPKLLLGRDDTKHEMWHWQALSQSLNPPKQGKPEPKSLNLKP